MSLPTEEIMETQTLTLTIVYDNNAYDPRPVLSEVEGLKTAWGFSCLIEYRGQVILFDTGGDSPTLLANMAKLGIDPGEIEAVVLSHIHGDHTDGLSGLLPMAGDSLTVFVPQSFPARFKDAVRTRTHLVEVREPREIGDGVYTTGELGTGIIEIKGILSEFRRLGVRKVAPCHCTGEQAIKMFRQEYGEDFIQAGVGKVIRVLPSKAKPPHSAKGGFCFSLINKIPCEAPFLIFVSVLGGVGLELQGNRSPDHIP
jgi:7,8-dihydropterin-6-yl-methyl-4-(beta-D-ribofuranosyl)aminobenzene 5'-phosphate synthase